jgi:hypothetical protein
VNKLAFSKRLKSFFGYQKFSSGTFMLLELGLPSFSILVLCCIIIVRVFNAGQLHATMSVNTDCQLDMLSSLSMLFVCSL